MALSAPQMAGDQLNPVDIENHTLVVVPVEFREHVPTVHSKPGENSPAIVCNVADLSAAGGVPVVYRGVMWFNQLLHGGLRRQLGQTILGRMVKGQGQPGKNPPWTLLDVMSEPDWVTYAENWLKTPEGLAFETEAQSTAASVGVTPAAALAGAATPAAAPPPAPAAPSAPPAAPPASAPPAAPPVAPAPAAAPPVAAPGADLSAALGALPPEELQKMLAAIANQNQAAH